LSKLFTLSQAGHAEQTINKSRFIAVAVQCGSESQVTSCLADMASQYRDAHHLAFAFRLKTDQGINQRFHDAGEPSGTAGKPILIYLEAQGLINICVAVIRYYGGINLGTGGLTRAYGGTAKLAVEAGGITPYVEQGQVRLMLDYADFDTFSRELARLNGQILDKRFAERVEVLAQMPADSIAHIKSRFGTGSL
jgi:uncharacterized YigZ family protein